MAVYNAAAWLRRHQTRLAVNAVVYLAAVIWEQRRVVDHLAPCLPQTTATVDRPDEPLGDEPKAA
jgi:hypothetical protein